MCAQSPHTIAVPTALDPSVAERIAAALAHDVADRIPVWEHLNHWELVEHHRGPEDAEFEALARAHAALGVDLTHHIEMPADPAREGEVVADAEGERIVLEGIAWRRRPIRSLDELPSYSPPEESEVWLQETWLSTFRVRQAALAPRTLLVPEISTGFERALEALGLELFGYALIDTPAEVARIIEEGDANALRRARIIAEAGLKPIAFVGGDIAMKGSLLFSPQALCELLLPGLRRVIEPLKAEGVAVIYHSDGDVTAFGDELTGAGIDGLHPCEPVAGVDLAALRRRYGRNLVLVGGIDASQVLPFGTPAEIQAEVIRCLAAAAGGGYILGSSAEIGPAMPLENVDAYAAALCELNDALL